MNILSSVIAAVIAFLSPVSSTAPAERSGIVGFVGDSITAFNIDVISDRLADCGAPPVTFDAVSGRQAMNDHVPPGSSMLPSGYSAIEFIEQTADPSVWVFEIGINDLHVGRAQTRAGARALVDGAVDLVDRTDTIYWVNTYSRYAPTWPILNEAIAANERVQVLDWASRAPTNVSDGVHPSPAGVEILSEMYCDALT